MKSKAPPRVSGPLAGGIRHTGTLRPAAPPPPSPAKESPEKTYDLASLARRKLSPSEFNTAMVHFYRGEIQRSNAWRNRLDTTTNWAVLTAGATLSFAFSAPHNPHFVILINSVLVAFFLFMEARRYRYYEIWSSRVRVMETGYFAQLLAPDRAVVDTEWADHLTNDLLTPHFTISEWEAVGRRLRRNYLWIFILLAASWNLKVYLHPEPARDFEEFIERAAVGVLPGQLVFMIGVLFNSALFIFALVTLRLREATGEVLPHHEFSLRPLRRVTDWTRAAAQERRRTILRRTRRARARTRTAATTTGETKKPSTGPLRPREKADEPVAEETLK